LAWHQRRRYWRKLRGFNAKTQKKRRGNHHKDAKGTKKEESKRDLKRKSPQRYEGHKEGRKEEDLEMKKQKR
jgi:hypothetical protein